MFCFCVTAAARPLCVPWTSKTAVVSQQVVQRRQSGGRTIVMVSMVAEWRHSGRHSDCSMNAIGRPKEVQWWYKGGRSIAQIDTHCLQLYELFYGTTNGRPLCIHSVTTAMRVPSFSLLWAICQQPTSSATFVRLFWTCSKLHCDHGVHGEVWTSSVRPLNDQGNLSASSLCLQRRPGHFCGHTREAQRSQPLCKGGITRIWYHLMRTQSLGSYQHLIRRYYHLIRANVSPN